MRDIGYKSNLKSNDNLHVAHQPSIFSSHHQTSDEIGVVSHLCSELLTNRMKLIHLWWRYNYISFYKIVWIIRAFWLVNKWVFIALWSTKMTRERWLAVSILWEFTVSWKKSNYTRASITVAQLSGALMDPLKVTSSPSCDFIAQLVRVLCR